MRYGKESISVLFLLLFAAGCETIGGGSFNILSTQQEIALGKELAVEIEKKEKVLADSTIQNYVRGIGERLARVSSRQGVPYSFKVIDNPDTVNAFALPGGNMYFYTGLMKLCANEAELAAVMAHEMGHVAAEHHGRSMTRQYGYNLIAGVILGGEPAASAELVAGLIGTTVTMRFSREQEREADALGMEFLFRAGYNPGAMLTFMKKMQAEERKNGGGNWLPIFASHPPTQERLQLLKTLEQRYPQDLVANSPVYAERYRTTVLSRLK